MQNLDDDLLALLGSFGAYTLSTGSDETTLCFSDPHGFGCEWTKLSLTFVAMHNSENENLPMCVELANEIRQRFDRFQDWLKQEVLERLKRDGIPVSQSSLASELSSCTLTVSVYDKSDVYGWNGYVTFNLTMSDGDLLVVPIAFPT